MEYVFRGSLTINAKNLTDALMKIQKIAPDFDDICLSDIREKDRNTNKVLTYRIPTDTSRRGYCAMLPVLAWEKIKGMRIALVSGPNHQCYCVDRDTGIILTRFGKEEITDRTPIKLRKFCEEHADQLKTARVIDAKEFWVKSF